MSDCKDLKDHIDRLVRETTLWHYQTPTQFPSNDPGDENDDAYYGGQKSPTTWGCEHDWCWDGGRKRWCKQCDREQVYDPRVMEWKFK